MTLQARAIWFIGVIAAIGIAGLWVGYPIDRIWRWLAALLVLALFIEWRAAHAAAITLDLAQSNVVRLARPHVWQLHIHNQGRAPVAIKCRPNPPAALQGQLADTQATLTNNETHTVEFQQTAEQLGEHAWPDQPIELSGIFGIATWTRRFALPDTVTVVEPDYLEPARKRGASSAIGARLMHKKHIGGTEFRSLREYAPGDPPATFDWKATARNRRAIVRETHMEQQLSLFFLMDTGRSSALTVGSLQTISHAANLIARMTEIAETHGDRYGIMTYADAPISQIAPSKGPTHQRKIRQLLTHVSTSAADANPLAAAIPTLRLLPQRALVLLFNNLDDVGAGSQLQQATSLLRPKHLPMIVHIEDEGVKELTSELAQDEDSVYMHMAAQEYIDATRQSREQLERIGAIVIQAPPERIENAVFDRYTSLRGNYRV